MFYLKLRWYGHACFGIESSEGTAIFDPYSPAYVPGLSLPPLTADAVFCSHGHKDHNYTDGVKLTGNTPSFSVSHFQSFHDGKRGAQRGENTMTLIEAEGIRVLHLGDLGHELTAAQVKQFGRVDVLLIPVGGYYTIDAVQALSVMNAIKPAVAVPMHYRGEGFGYQVLGEVGDFLSLVNDWGFFDGSLIELELKSLPSVLVMKCPVSIA